MRKRILLAFGLVIVLALIVLVVIISMRPSEYAIERKHRIQGPGSILFEQVDDFRNWNEWSPWAKRDPNMKTTFEGPASGVGAIYKWSGNKDVGEGQMKILESKQYELIRIQIDFIKPFEQTGITTFHFSGDCEDDSYHEVKVLWRMEGRRSFMAKGVCVFTDIDMDKLMGDDFEQGLSQLDLIVKEKSKNFVWNIPPAVCP